jgi:hypothetical protein
MARDKCYIVGGMQGVPRENEKGYIVVRDKKTHAGISGECGQVYNTSDLAIFHQIAWSGRYEIYIKASQLKSTANDNKKRHRGTGGSNASERHGMGPTSKRDGRDRL